MTGTLIDCCAIALGTTIGTIANSKFKESNFSEKVMQTLALCAFLVGITGCIDVSNPIVAILSLVITSADKDRKGRGGGRIWKRQRDDAAIFA